MQTAKKQQEIFIGQIEADNHTAEEAVKRYFTENFDEPREIQSLKAIRYNEYTFKIKDGNSSYLMKLSLTGNGWIYKFYRIA